MCLTWINTYNMDKKTIYLDRNEYNYGPAPEVGEVLKNFDPNKLCFYTRIYDEGKKSILSDYLSQVYDIPEKQIILGYGGEDILKQVVHCFLAGKEKQKTLLIPKFSWWYYKSIADESKEEVYFILCTKKAILSNTILKPCRKRSNGKSLKWFLSLLPTTRPATP